MGYVTTPSHVVLINGKPYGHITPSRWRASSSLTFPSLCRELYISIREGGT